MAKAPHRKRPGVCSLPLTAWWDVRLPADRRIGQPRKRVLSGAAPLAIGIAALGLTIVSPPIPRLLWNASRSVPIGLYAVAPGAVLQRGDMVVAWPPFAVQQLAARRHYLPLGVPLVKPVAAVAGDDICAAGAVISVNGRPVARRREGDAAGRPLPRWTGCSRLGSGMVLLMGEAPDSFDGRYFGPSPARDLIGTATALWLR